MVLLNPVPETEPTPMTGPVMSTVMSMSNPLPSPEMDHGKHAVYSCA